MCGTFAARRVSLFCVPLVDLSSVPSPLMCDGFPELDGRLWFCFWFRSDRLILFRLDYLCLIIIPARSVFFIRGEVLFFCA